jgi:hypothetical protein
MDQVCCFVHVVNKKTPSTSESDTPSLAISFSGYSVENTEPGEEFVLKGKKGDDHEGVMIIADPNANSNGITIIKMYRQDYKNNPKDSQTGQYYPQGSLVTFYTWSDLWNKYDNEPELPQRTQQAPNEPENSASQEKGSANNESPNDVPTKPKE